MEITVRGNKAALKGRQPEVGSEAPAAQIKRLDGSVNVIGAEQVKTQLLIAIPSLKTEVCSYGAKKFNEMLAEAKKIDATIITTDDLEVCQKFAQENDMQNVNIVVDANGMFGERFGIKISEGMLEGKLARAIFVIDKEGIVAYKEIVPEIVDEVNYDKALEAANEAAGKKKKHVHGHHNHGW